LRREGIEIDDADEPERRGKWYGARDAGTDERAPLLGGKAVKHAHFAITPSLSSPPHSASASKNNNRRSPPTLDLENQPPPPSPEALLARFERVRVWLAVAYGATSGTLSGLCLLFTKTGMEVLILTVVGKNQFGHVEAWMIILVLLVCELFQVRLSSSLSFTTSALTDQPSTAVLPQPRPSPRRTHPRLPPRLLFLQHHLNRLRPPLLPPSRRPLRPSSCDGQRRSVAVVGGGLGRER
jgi:hypothetical protein